MRELIAMGILVAGIGLIYRFVLSPRTRQQLNLAAAPLGLPITPWSDRAEAVVRAICETDGAEIARAVVHAAQGAAELGAEISSMEFDLAAFRSQVQVAGKLASDEFITPGDYDEFLTAASKPTEDERVAGVTAALERSPRMQPAALHLADHFRRKGDVSACLQFADKVIETAPSILLRDALRAQAYNFKAQAARLTKDSKAAVHWSDLGLAAR